MIKKILWLPILALSLFFSQASFSHHGKSGEHAKHHFCMQSALQELNLTADQQAKIKAVKLEAKQSLKEKWQEIRAINKQMKALARTNKLDHAKVDALINQKKELMGSVMKTKIIIQNQIYNLLDDIQKAKLAAIAEKCEQERMNGKKS